MKIIIFLILLFLIVLSGCINQKTELEATTTIDVCKDLEMKITGARYDALLGLNMGAMATKVTDGRIEIHMVDGQVIEEEIKNMQPYASYAKQIMVVYDKIAYVKLVSIQCPEKYYEVFKEGIPYHQTFT